VTAERGSKTVEIAIRLRRGASLEGRVLDAAGQPVAEGTAIACFNVSAQAVRCRGASQIPIRGGRLVVPGLEPGRSYRVLVHDARNTLGAVAELPASETGYQPVTIGLAPCGSARIRLFDPSGMPVVHYRAAVQIVMTPGPFRVEFDASNRGETLAAVAGSATYSSRYLAGERTDAAGRATFTGLILGATYRLLTTEREDISIGSEFLKDFQVAPGETLELPVFTIKRSPIGD
jgi:hypothetical protein